MELMVKVLIIVFCVSLGVSSNAKIAVLETPAYTKNALHQYMHNTTDQDIHLDDTRVLKKVFLSNRAITCNDGSQAGFYLRKSRTSKKWIIFLEGGWYCYDSHSCKNRWLRQRHYMTSSQWPDKRDMGGILSPHQEENPYWYNVNHVFVPYCTSDSWSGTMRSKSEMFTFMGSLVVQQVVKDLIPLGLENSTDLLLAGSSAGGTGVMINLDPVRELLHNTWNLKHIIVKGVADSGWFLDQTPLSPSGKQPTEAIRKGMKLWSGKVPKRCRKLYSDEPWKCYFGYRLYPTLRTPLYVFQWLFDEAQINVDNVGAPVSKQQWDYIHKMGDALRKSFENVTAVFAPSCISHSVLTKRDWMSVKVDEVTFARALFCWSQEEPRINRRRRRKNFSSVDSVGEPSLIRKQLGRNMLKSGEENSHNNRDKKRRKSKKNKRSCQFSRENPCHNMKNRHKLSNSSRSRRSVLRQQKHSTRSSCSYRRLERCTWPQCNYSCPSLHNPYTGEEMDFIELLKSFGLEMESVAEALGMDMSTLNSMDHLELLDLLTQQTT